MNLYDEIFSLIESKNEGQYWDFKREPHKKNEDLLHDILCLANAKHDGDRFLIIGVDDPSEDCKIIGLNDCTDNRKNEANLNDFLNNKHFAGGNVPKVNVRTLDFESKEVDVIIIKNSQFKPFYLEENYEYVKAFHIYTRTGDRNTPKNKNANFKDIEYMWKEHFNLNLDVEERFKRYLNDFGNWNLDFDAKKSALYKLVPEFSIELSEINNTNCVEPFNTFYLDNSLSYGDALFKYNDNDIFNCIYAYCDGGRVLMPHPKYKLYKRSNSMMIGFYYYCLDDIEGLFAKLITKNTFNFECRFHSFPFIVVDDNDMLNAFIKYLDENLDISDINADISFNKNDPNKYTSSKSLESLVYIALLFKEWKLCYFDG